MTYDLDAVAAAVRTVAPRARFRINEATLDISWKNRETYVDSGGFISVSLIGKERRAIVRTVIDELDRQDAEHAGILHATSAAPEAT